MRTDWPRAAGVYCPVRASLAPVDPNWQDAAARPRPAPGTGWAPTATGAICSRLIYGTRPALGLVAPVTVITLPAGLLVGILSGYYGGWVERILMRFTDVVMSMPRLILAFAFVAMLGPGWSTARWRWP